MRLAVGLLISIVFHGLLLTQWGIFFTPDSVVLLSPPPVSVVIEFKPGPTTSSPHLRPLKSSAGNSVKAQSHAEKSKLINDIFRRDEFTKEASAVRASLENVDFAGGDQPALPSNDNFAFHQEVFRRIDNHLLFDSLLAQYKHFGTVYIEFKVSERGYLLSEGLRATADDSVLKVHVLRALRKGLTEQFARADWSIYKEGALFQARFEFAYSNFETNFRNNHRFERPVLSFRRVTSEKAVANNLTDHLLNGGIDYDVFAAAEKWRKYNKMNRLKAGEFDPFVHYRRDPDYSL